MHVVFSCKSFILYNDSWRDDFIFYFVSLFISRLSRLLSLSLQPEFSTAVVKQTVKYPCPHFHPEATAVSPIAEGIKMLKTEVVMPWETNNFCIYWENWIKQPFQVTYKLHLFIYWKLVLLKFHIMKLAKPLCKKVKSHEGFFGIEGLENWVLFLITTASGAVKYKVCNIIPNVKCSYRRLQQ